jgi:hypothetical protein
VADGAAAGEVRLHESWRAPLGEEFASPYMAALKSFLVGEKAAGKRIFPKGAEWFAALDLTPLDRVRVVILGQDPYHGLGQAHGLCFSVEGCRNAFPVAAASPDTIHAYDVRLREGVPMTNRTSYVIAPNGRIIYAFSDLDYHNHVANTLAAVRDWQAHHRRHR